VQNLLVVGTETVVGANLAASLAEKYQVSTWSAERRYDVPNCAALDVGLSPSQVVAACRPDWVLLCGPASRSAWEVATSRLMSDQMVDDAATWGAAAKDGGSKIAMISSDAVFTGPWMFHEEDSTGLCHSAQAMAVRAAEQALQEAHRGGLVVRTNAFGWSPDPAGKGWVEQLLEGISARRLVEQDHIRHATPILATELAGIVERACLENLSGVYHVGGAERVSPLKFAQRLADQFNLPWLSIRREGPLAEAARGFGAGECSLQTKKIRKALCVAMPLLSEGLSQLAEQDRNGYRARLRGAATERQARAA
jgi:dTDP-4-dehydrorhamnose reductase